MFKLPNQQPIKHKPPHNNQESSPGVGLISVIITFWQAGQVIYKIGHLHNRLIGKD